MYEFYIIENGQITRMSDIVVKWDDWMSWMIGLKYSSPPIHLSISSIIAPAFRIKLFCIKGLPIKF